MEHSEYIAPKPVLYDTNYNGVRICYSVKDDKPIFVGVRGSTQDLTPIVQEGVISHIGEQIRAAIEFQKECQRKDESGPVDEVAAMARRMAEQGGSEPDGPEADSADGFTLEDDHDPEFCDDPLCEEPECVKSRAATAGDAAYHAKIDDEVEDRR